MGLIAATLLFGMSAQAANILVNPGFEADGNHGNGAPITAWSFSTADPYWINVDSYAHSGANYYKVWGAFNGNPNWSAVWQDNSCLPGAKYQADGWMFNLGTDSIFQDGNDFAWLEVSFRDASDNILALYKSDNFCATNSNYTDNTWYDMPITNICNPNPPYQVIGTTNELVAPPGTVKVRFQHTYYQLLWGGGSTYFDDATLNQTFGPVPPTLSNIYPGNMLFASNHISFTINSASSTPIPTSGIHLVVNGTDVSADLKITGSSPTINVIYTNLLTNVWAYTASITVTDSIGFTASANMNFDTVNPTFVWEAEDYDFTNGLYYDNPLLTSTVQLNSYFGVTGVVGTDYGSSSTGHAIFRPDDTTGTGPAGDSARQVYLNAQVGDPAVIDYTVGYIAQYDWFNYTRDIPAGNYNIYGRLAGGAGATVVSLDDVTTPGVTNNLGYLKFTGSDWGAYQYVPAVDNNGNVLQFALSGKKTLRATLLSGGDNMNFFFLVPAAPAVPTLSNIAPTNGTMFASGNTFSFTVTAAGGVGINNSGIHLYLNGADVSANLNITSPDPTNKNVSYTLLLPNTLYTAVIAVTNVNGAGVSRTISFDTMSTGNFYVKINDFDYNGGAYDTNGNGLIPAAYQGDQLPNDTGAILNIDYYHTSGGNYPYRGPNALATEVTQDVPLPGFTSGNSGDDYDVGNFNNGDWGNYTRDYPAGKYLVYGRMAGYSQNTALSQVVGGWGTSSQTLKLLGTWPANPGGWQNWVWIPLQLNGAPVIVSLGGVQTLRVTSANNVNANYFMLVPATGIKLSIALSGGNAQLSFPTQAGGTYEVLYTTNPASGNWTVLTTVPGTGAVQVVSDPLTGTGRFYKVVSK